MKVLHFFTNRSALACILSGVVLGVIITLITPAIRYSQIIEPTIKDIKPQEVYKNISENPDKYIFLDVRTKYEYDMAHASGSVSMPINTLYDTRETLPKKGKDIYLICTSGKLAGVAYSYLEHYGFRNIYRVEGGMQGWSEAGLPIIAQDLFDASKKCETPAPMLDIPFDQNES